LTAQAEAAIRAADRPFYLATQPGMGYLLRDLNPRAESLHDCYREGEDGVAAGEEMVERILAPLRLGLTVCAAFSGHPGIFMHVPHECLRRARSRGVEARLLPGVSVVDCLLADLEVDSRSAGCQLFEATEFLLRPKSFDTRVPLVLLQAGALGVVSWRESVEPNRAGLRLLVEALLRHYPESHEAVVYEIDALPPWEPRIGRCELRSLAEAPLAVMSTLLLPPLDAGEQGPRSTLYSSM
jgi:hypothetical protein